MIPDSTDAIMPSPLHGYPGDRQLSRWRGGPRRLTIAVSRESGARGSSIAQRVGKKLSWNVYTQELLEYLAQDETQHAQILTGLSREEQDWIDNQLNQLCPQDHGSGIAPELQRMARVILRLAVSGNVIIVGRGAGFLLPSETTLHVRIVAPLADRVASMSQWLRLTPEQATEQVLQKDQRRNDFLTRHLGVQPAEVHWYDLVLNSSKLGEELCANLIVTAARGKQPLYEPSDVEPEPTDGNDRL